MDTPQAIQKNPKESLGKYHYPVVTSSSQKLRDIQSEYNYDEFCKIIQNICLTYSTEISNNKKFADSLQSIKSQVQLINAMDNDPNKPELLRRIISNIDILGFLYRPIEQIKHSFNKNGEIKFSLEHDHLGFEELLTESESLIRKYPKSDSIKYIALLISSCTGGEASRTKMHSNSAMKIKPYELKYTNQSLLFSHPSMKFITSQNTDVMLKNKINNNIIDTIQSLCESHPNKIISLTASVSRWDKKKPNLHEIAFTMQLDDHGRIENIIWCNSHIGDRKYNFLRDILPMISLLDGMNLLSDNVKRSFRDFKIFFDKIYKPPDNQLNNVHKHPEFSKKWANLSNFIKSLPNEFSIQRSDGLCMRHAYDRITDIHNFIKQMGRLPDIKPTSDGQFEMNLSDAKIIAINNPNIFEIHHNHIKSKGWHKALEKAADTTSMWARDHIEMIAALGFPSKKRKDIISDQINKLVLDIMENCALNIESKNIKITVKSDMKWPIRFEYSGNDKNAEKAIQKMSEFINTKFAKGIQADTDNYDPELTHINVLPKVKMSIKDYVLWKMQKDIIGQVKILSSSKEMSQKVIYGSVITTDTSKSANLKTENDKLLIQDKDLKIHDIKSSIIQEKAISEDSKNRSNTENTYFRDKINNERMLNKQTHRT